MRLLHTETGNFVVVDNPRDVRFAILSHVWAKKGDHDYIPEQSYQRVCRIQASVQAEECPLLRLSNKIQKFCAIARSNGFKLGWVDSACINQESSSELSEAINSMYNWYSYAGACYVILHDVDDVGSPEDCEHLVPSSKWFTRGWTLQELLAPSVVLFLSKTWKVIGTKHTLADLIEEVTGIERAVILQQKPLEEVSVSRRMSWAAKRHTTREEDEAYSLMGIFGVNMPTTYGEGRYAFTRLQEEILRRIPDETIFAWGRRHTEALPFDLSSPTISASSREIARIARKRSAVLPNTPTPTFPAQYLLASSPKDFQHSSDLRPLKRQELADRIGWVAGAEDVHPTFTATPYGIPVPFPLLVASPHRGSAYSLSHVALLACADHKERVPALLLRPTEFEGQYFVGTVIGQVTPDSQYTLAWDHYARVVYLSPSRGLGGAVSGKIFIPHRPSHTAVALERDISMQNALREMQHGRMLDVRLCGWSRELLSRQGYKIEPRDDDNIALCDRPLSRTLIQTQPGISITSATNLRSFAIQVGRCSCEYGERYGFLGVHVFSPSRSKFRLVQDSDFRQQPHVAHNPIHIHSWRFSCGVASLEIELSPPGTSEDRLTLRLTVTSRAEIEGSDMKTYRLGVEIRSSRRESMTGPPDQTSPQMLSPPPSIQRTRSNSLPDNVRRLGEHPTTPPSPPSSDRESDAPVTTGGRLQHERVRHRTAAHNNLNEPSTTTNLPVVSPRTGRARHAPSTAHLRARSVSPPRARQFFPRSRPSVPPTTYVMAAQTSPPRFPRPRPAHTLFESGSRTVEEALEAGSARVDHEGNYLSPFRGDSHLMSNTNYHGDRRVGAHAATNGIRLNGPSPTHDDIGDPMDDDDGLGQVLPLTYDWDSPVARDLGGAPGRSGRADVAGGVRRTNNTVSARGVPLHLPYAPHDVGMDWQGATPNDWDDAESSLLHLGHRGPRREDSDAIVDGAPRTSSPGLMTEVEGVDPMSDGQATSAPSYQLLVHPPSKPSDYLRLDPQHIHRDHQTAYNPSSSTENYNCNEESVSFAPRRTIASGDKAMQPQPNLQVLRPRPQPIQSVTQPQGNRSETGEGSTTAKSSPAPKPLTSAISPTPSLPPTVSAPAAMQSSMLSESATPVVQLPSVPVNAAANSKETTPAAPTVQTLKDQKVATKPHRSFFTSLRLKKKKD